jgi:hypothetical protein
MNGAKEIAVRRDEVILVGTGLISLGKSTSIQPELCVKFSIEIS